VARRRLADIQLSRGSRIVRLGLFWAIGACSAVAAITYVIPGHRDKYETVSHSDYSEGGAIPLIGAVAMTLLAAWLARKKFGSGMICATVGAVGAVLELARTILYHLFSTPLADGLEIVHIVSLLVMFLACVLMLCIEPVLYLVERSSQERAERSIPTARVVNT
jgi:hypothetical protein